ncbi:hypothetical protein [Stenotrophomonas oahuensis]|uniref:Uncharacterized protein n=1 Tax=Stenotrophomonas oahuensis TaxID=3003271 RepID=A0ABY9YRG4_9GAMM|nr:hypothetical protein [Stenotrophomonas sp. A5586]WNH53516.1 hypothetical protein PDM29_04330 [Stenotrophomonas sp. A5586]
MELTVYLRDVMVLPTEHSREGNLRLRAASDHVLNTLRHYLPKKYDFNGMWRLVIYLGPNTDGKRFWSPEATGGVGEFLADSFDLDGWFDAPQDKQDVRILQCVEDALVERAVEFGTDAEPLRTAVQSVRDAGYRLDTELPCSRTHPSRKFRVRLIRRFAPGGTFVIVRVTTPKGEVLHEEELLAGAWVVTVGDDYRGGRWNGDALEILDVSGRMTTTVSCTPYLSV